jgi:transcription elongation factor GreA
VVELPTSPAKAPVDLGRVGAWLAHRPELRMDGTRPSGKELAARLSAFWLPGEPVIFAGSTEVSIGGRVTALYNHVPGDRRPHPEGQWMHILFGLSAARVWWASTDAPDEALDAFLTAFADGVEPEVRATLHDPAVVLPFATTRRPTGERKAHGLTGYVTPAERVLPLPPARVTELPAGAAEGVEESEAGPGMRPRDVAPPADKPVRRRPDDGSGPVRTTRPLTPAPRRSGGTAGNSAAPTGRSTRSSARSSGTGVRAARAAEKAAEAAARAIPPTIVTADGVDRLQAEHAELTGVRRPAVIQRIRTAKEHGDLKENAEYHAAREEQSFLEGRILSIEAILRNHLIIETPAAGHTSVHLGSTVTIEDDLGPVTYTIVGSTEASPGEGRISSSSPVGSALIGRQVGDQVVVRTPRGEARYRVVAIE